MKSHAMGASTDISCVPSSVQDAASYALENGTEFLLTKTALAAAVPEAFSYAKGILLLIVTYLAWEQGYMLASRWANAGSISDDMSRGLRDNANPSISVGCFVPPTKIDLYRISRPETGDTSSTVSSEGPIASVHPVFGVSGLSSHMHAGGQRVESCCLALHSLFHLLEVLWRWC